MMHSITKYYRRAVLAGIVSLFAVSLAWADMVSDWSSTANNILVAAKVPGGYSYSHRQQ